MYPSIFLYISVLLLESRNYFHHREICYVAEKQTHHSRWIKSNLLSLVLLGSNTKNDPFSEPRQRWWHNSFVGIPVGCTQEQVSLCYGCIINVWFIKIYVSSPLLSPLKIKPLNNTVSGLQYTALSYSVMICVWTFQYVALILVLKQFVVVIAW